MSAEKLTRTEEIELLNLLITATPIGIGSSRVVFKHPQSDFLAIKFAPQTGGRNQNLLEVTTNKILPNLTNKIYNFGEYLLVCDLITCDLADFIEDGFRKGGDNWPKDYVSHEEENTIEIILESLEDVLGFSYDNGQIGRTWDNRIVAYDYGYSSKKDCVQVDRLPETLEKHKDLNEFLDDAIESLKINLKNPRRNKNC
jgi:hypothetical protein